MKNAIVILDPSFAELGLCKDCSFLSYTEDFREAGSAELCLPYDSAALELLRPDGYIRMPDGCVFRIASVRKDILGGTVTVRCLGLLSLLRGTVFPEEYSLSGDVCSLMYHLVRQASGNLPMPLALGDTDEVCSVSFSSGRSTLYDDLVSLCHLGDVGMSLEYREGRLLFTVLKLRDRTSGKDMPLNVSQRLGTFDSVTAVWDMDSYKNVAVVSGAETEEGGRYTVTVRSDSIGIGDTFPDGEHYDRQLLVNFTAPTRPYMKENAEGLLELDTEAYLAAMYSSGAAALGRCRPKLHLTGLCNSDTLRPGDAVTVADADSGIDGTAVAECVTTVYSAEGKSISSRLSCHLSPELLAKGSKNTIFIK